MSSFSPSTVNSATLRIADGIDRLAAMGHLALGQGVADEHGVDRLQVELGGQVHDRQIFVIELAMLLGRIAVALDEMTE